MKKLVITDRQANDIANKKLIKYMKDGMSYFKAQEQAYSDVTDNYTIKQTDFTRTGRPATPHPIY